MLLWNFASNTKGIIRKKVITSMVVTNFRVIIIDHEKNILDMLHLIPNLDDVIVMNTHRVSDSVGYGMHAGGLTGGYMRMAGPRFSSGTSKTMGDIIFIQNTLKSSWINIPDPTGLKNFIKSIKKTMYDPLTKLEQKKSRGGMNCSQCGIQNPRNAQFCNGCGSQLLQLCSNCKRLNPIGSSFCNKCGSQLGISYTIDLSDKRVSEVVEPSFQECRLSDYKVKIDYPSTWTRIYDNSNPTMKAIVQFQKEGPANQATVFLAIDNTVENITLDTFIENGIASMKQQRSDFKLIESTPSTLSGFAAHQIIYSIKEIKSLNVSTIKDKVAYSVIYVAEPDKYLKFLSSAEQMISSFEFMDQDD